MLHIHLGQKLLPDVDFFFYFGVQSEDDDILWNVTIHK